MRTMVSKEGWKSLWIGLGPSFMGLSHVAVQFPLYEYFKLTFRRKIIPYCSPFLKYWICKFLLEVQNKYRGRDHSNELGILGFLSASALSKMIACIVTYPHEVIRTRLQTQSMYHDIPSVEMKYRGVFNTGRIIIHDEGWRGLYKGLGTTLVRTVPATAISFCVYEMIVRHLTRSNGS